MKTKYIPLYIFIIALGYYIALSSKIFTWMFISADSADWLSVSNWWMVPQPLGSPLYVLLGQGLNTFPGSQVLKMTMVLSCLCSAITVTLVYLLVKHLTNNRGISVVCSVVLLSSTVFLTQSTILEEYAVTTMFLTVGLFFLIKNKMKLGFLFLGLATAVHIVILIVTGLITIGYLYKLKKKSLKLFIPLAIYAVGGILPYSMIPILMYLDTPRLMGGTFDWYHINGYFFGIGQGIVGTVSVFDFPKRLLDGLAILFTCLGLSLIPLVMFFRKPHNHDWLMTRYILFIPMAFALWYYFTCFDPGTWTFLMFGIPSMVIMAGIGLTKLRPYHARLVLVVALLLIVTNSVWLNADRLAHERPFATTFYSEVMNLPDGSAIILGPGAFSMTTIYALTEGKDIVPLVWQVVEHGFFAYRNYLSDEWDIQGNDIRELAQDAQRDGRNLYIAYYKESKELQWFCIVEIPGNKFVRRVDGVMFPSQYFLE